MPKIKIGLINVLLIISQLFSFVVALSLIFNFDKLKNMAMIDLNSYLISIAYWLLWLGVLAIVLTFYFSIKRVLDNERILMLSFLTYIIVWGLCFLFYLPILIS
ncbi:hypothetical protein ACR30L_16275 [Psychromonas sp. PT13]|uniref:hypothetical protein n=1 Tax=Psychromonas sp. PT13 TaxID=3439547 RepID=UPI003EC0F588